MELHKLTENLTVGGQIDPAEVSELAARGIRAIVCNRPDGEQPGQPSFQAIETAAAALGIKAIHQPVQSSAISDADVLAFAKALGELPKPIMAYCRTGTRSAMLWSLSEAGKRPAGDILSEAMKAGYDLSALAQRLEKLRRP